MIHQSRYAARGSVRMILMAAIAVIAVGSAAAELTGQTVSVSVRTAQLRRDPGHLAPLITQLAYTDQVRVLETRGDFLLVQFEGREGWLHTSAVSERRIVLQASDSDIRAAADRDEVALAGRGFNQQVEAEYRSQQGLPFDLVDRMEQRTSPVQDLRGFMIEGGLLDPDAATGGSL